MPADLMQLLRDNPYPGRGIVLGQTADGREMVALYFIMGRSENSRNRVFYSENGQLRIALHDPGLVKDPSLILYRPMLEAKGRLILTNGDQTETIHDALTAGDTFEDALRTRRHEPDAPHFTPRISGLLDQDTGDYVLSILKSGDRDGTTGQRHFFGYEGAAGRGHFIHTYQHDGEPLPSFRGEPVLVYIPQDAAAFADAVWSSLNRDHRIALCLWRKPLAGGQARLILYNRHKSQEEPCKNC